jgi:hypothetical protein
VPVFLHSHARWSTPPPHPPTHHCFACPSSPLSLIPAFRETFREIFVFWECVWNFPHDGGCGSRVGKTHSLSTPPPQARTTPFPHSTTRVFCF